MLQRVVLKAARPSSAFATARFTRGDATQSDRLQSSLFGEAAHAGFTPVQTVFWAPPLLHRVIPEHLSDSTKNPTSLIKTLVLLQSSVSTEAVKFITKPVGFRAGEFPKNQKDPSIRRSSVPFPNLLGRAFNKLVNCCSFRIGN